jgi:hypothetical protein
MEVAVAPLQLATLMVKTIGQRLDWWALLAKQVPDTS